MPPGPAERAQLALVDQIKSDILPTAGWGSMKNYSVELSSVDTNKWAPLLARDWEPSPSAQPALDSERRGPLRQRQNRLTPEQVAAMAARYLEGANVNELAAEFHCARQTVALRLKAHGVELRRRPATRDEIVQVVELYASGLSLAGVAETTRFSAKSVLNHLRAEGVQLRDTHGRAR